MFSALIFSSLLSLISVPADPATKLLEEYLAIRTDHPENGTQAAAKMWMREAQYYGLSAATWTLDPQQKCTHFVARLPATVESSGRPIMLIHHGDTVSAIESEWDYPPFKPQWVQGKTDWYLYGRGAIDDKSHGVIHWIALRSLLEKQRNRDVYFVMNCGEEVGDERGAKAFSHFFFKSLPDFKIELSSLEKLELAMILEKFPSLPKTEFIWNEGSFGEKTQIAPYTLVPIATSQKAYWLGRVTVKGAGGHGALLSKQTALEVVNSAVQELYDENQSFKPRLSALHHEMEELVREIRKTRPIWQRFLLWLYPRFFFEFTGLQTMVTSWWVPSRIESNSTMPNVIPSEVSVTLEYRYLGDKDKISIEQKLADIFKSKVRQDFSIKVETFEYIPFRRDFFEGSEAKIFETVLREQPQTLVSPFITPGLTDSRYFRISGIRSFDLVPLFLTSDEIAAMHSKNERIPYTELKRAVDIESRILEKLVQ